MGKQQLSRFGVRLPLALAAAAAIATAAVLATGGSAQTPPSSLHFVSKEQRGVGFFPHHRPHQGDRFGFGDTITGADTGVDRGVCTLIGKNALCTVQLKLSKGTVSAQGLSSLRRNTNTPFAITGGTGAYNGARGTMVHDESTKPNRNIFELLP